MSVPKFLSQVRGFSTIPIDDLEVIATRIEERSYKQGDHLIRKGDDGDHMHVLRSGTVRIPITDTDGNTKAVVKLGPQDLVGEMALLTGEPRNADVIAESDVSSLVIHKNTLDPMLEEYPPLARFLTEILGKRLEEDGGIEWVGKYRLVGKLGEGATAKVYQGIHPGLNRVVAIKMLSHSLVYDKSFKERFLQEARTIAGLTHPNIVQLFDTEAGYATYFIVMEKVSGTDLSKLLKKRKTLDPIQTMDILSQMGKALAYAHKQGLCHRDVKPANCAVDDEGVVKLMDFGIAKRIPKNPSEKRAKMVEGTPRYLAPEAAVGRPVDGRADIYALGIMAFEMATGRVPFYSDTIRELLHMQVRTPPPDVTSIRPGLPDNLVKFINGALIKRPEERLSDWSQIQKLLATGDSGAELRSRRAEERNEVITISYPRGAASRVDASVCRLAQELEGVAGVSVGRANVIPMGDDGQECEGDSWFFGESSGDDSHADTEQDEDVANPTIRHAID